MGWVSKYDQLVVGATRSHFLSTFWILISFYLFNPASQAHGTFIGSIRLEANKPQQVFIDSELKFGASTRTYIIRERPQMNKHFPSMLQQQANSTSMANTSNSAGGSNNTSLNSSMILDEDKEDLNNRIMLLSSLPETEAELDVSLKVWIRFGKKVLSNYKKYTNWIKQFVMNFKSIQPFSIGIIIQ